MSIEPKDLREGDRVRITVDGTVSTIFSTGSISICFDDSRLHTIGPSACAEITRLDPPIRVGDRVRHQEAPNDTAVVLAIDEDAAWLKWDGGPRQVSTLASLTRLPEGQP